MGSSLEHYLKLPVGHCIMQFKEFDWLSGHGIWAIIPCPTNMVSIHMKFWGLFYCHFSLVFHDFERHLITLNVGYEMIIANGSASLAIYHLICNARSWNNC